MDYKTKNSYRYFFELSTDEKIIDLYQRGYSIPYAADHLGLTRRYVALQLGFLDF